MRPAPVRVPRPAATGILLAILAPIGLARGQDAPGSSGPLPPPADRSVDFLVDIKPILDARCVSCHGAERQKSGLRLDQKAGAMAGGDLGPAIEPGAGADSLLIHRVAGFEGESIMPPTGAPLSPQEVGLLRGWIDQGATWSEAGAGGGSRRPSDHWAFRPIEPDPPPDVRDEGWVRSPIDRYVLARLESAGISPSREADRATLIRRLSLDLTGLPPSPEEVDAFEADDSPASYEAFVDRLLASPHFGERWGRHWLDLARYADSDGYEKDRPRPEAYRFRDWVIAAINRDLPFDRFTIEQLAGDLLPDASPDRLTAAGFHRNTLTNTEGGVDAEEFRVAAVIDRVNTTGSVWLGLTVACAQCHTHKYDPITRREYYQLFAFFNSADEADRPIESGSSSVRDAGTEGDEPGPRIRTFVEQAGEDRRESRIHIRGDFLRPGEPVEPGTFEVLPPLPETGGRPDRLDLAEWVVDPENPLTGRVAANRVWHHLFGRALVTSMDDFGTRGESPSHPELLDWLASEYRRLGWSRKGLIRAIVRSSTYRQASAVRPELREVDPENVLLARQNRIRLEAEVIRDLALAVGGLLSTEVGGPSVFPPQPPGISELTYASSARWEESSGPDRHRRGLYTFFRRTSPYPMLTTFDAPDANVCAVKRSTSNTPLQALTLLNDAAFVEGARALGLRALREDPSLAALRAFRLALGREPTVEELEILDGLRASLLHALQADAGSVHALLGGEVPPHGIGRAEAAAIVATSRAILNLDEFITRE
ncbi:PSD1 and planctomycete cytochrome C domain-containing protein [Tautonia plasticadhaerens]|uniref:Planctomycete cytochrome C n=1 Tax=Tautonia plasticadhaerens TaxID=2527974 RepID=A0A518H7E8_9BACT|nr:PSD1 and planctomycete cytochrome C domain-containing protein [Tautonia plasticadhaerens]QDV36788.1 Planctomycete cytochrome C [Tautonia plasticadhaerens]